MPAPAKLIEFSVENYKAFAKATTLSLRPITLLYGFNSIGKSALLRLLPMLGASADWRQHGPLALNSGSIRGAAFNDLLSRHSSSNYVAFSLKWELSDGKTVGATYKIRDLPELKSQVVEELEITRDGQFAANLLWSPSEKERGGGEAYILRMGDGSTEVGVTFRGLVPLTSTFPFENWEYTELINDLRFCLKELSASVHWLSALRAVPDRYARYVGVRGRVGENGESAGQALAFDKAAGGNMLGTVSRWYEEATKHQLSLSEFSLGSGEGFSLELSDQRSKAIAVNLVDTGEGMGQVLPVLVIGAMASDSRLSDAPILCIEHPELHLQPSTHGHLASYFARVISSAPDATVLVETHSESLLLQTQLQIASGNLKCEDVVVYWLDRDDSGDPSLERITFDALARPVGQNWPSQAFSSSTELAKQIVSERIARENHQAMQVPPSNEG